MVDAPNFELMQDFYLYDSSNNPILYHYCDLNAFLSIINTRSIRLSDINTMNDYREMNWGYERFLEAANLDFGEHDEAFLNACDKILAELQTHTLPTVACLSLDGDVLSQWRAYASDGSGVAIGFDGCLIEKLSVRCARVVYSPADQVEFIRHNLAALKPIWECGDTDPKAKREFREFAFNLAVDMCSMKNPAFSEEQEVRIIRALSVDHKDGQWHLTDPGGNSSDKPSKRKLEVMYRARSGGLIAYVDLPFRGLGNKAIREVVVGPKSMNNGIELSMALSANGFTDFEIRHSRATYR